jgi:cell division protein FtsA
VRRGGSRTSRAIGVLDIGTSKICCLIAVIDDRGEPVLAGLGYQRSRGLKSGMVVDPDEAERAVRPAIAQAERMAGLTLDRVTLSVSCGRIRSSNFTARATLEGRVVRDGDLDRLLEGAQSYVELGGRTLIQLGRSDWRLDGAPGVRDPLGMAGRELSSEINAVTADEAPVRNLINVVERCHLEVGRLFVSPFASGLAVTQPEERDTGVLVVDIGAGVTTLAGFAEGRLVLAESLPVGGNHVTYDISRSLVTPVAEAERIKTLYGTLVKAQSDQSEAISFEYAGSDGGEEESALFQTTRSHVREIIEARVDSLLALIKDRLDGSTCGALLNGPVVLTGGGSQLLGLENIWIERFGGPARVGRPRPIGRMPSNVSGSAFATVVGLTYADQSVDADAAERTRHRPAGARYFGRMQQWIRESF